MLNRDAKIVYSTLIIQTNMILMFLCRELNLPSGDGLMGVRKAGIALLCHMDRLGAPLLPPLKGFVTVSTHLSFMFYTHPQGEMKVICIAIISYL